MRGLTLNALNKKLLRDLWHIRGQVIAIALVIGCGVATLVMSLGTLHSLEETRRAYYERYRFADIFGHATRAPEWVGVEIALIPGVSTSETRIVHDIVIDVAGLDQPARGRVISLAPNPHNRLNDVVIRQGRAPLPGRPDEVLIHEAFAESHGLVPGDIFHANINKRRRKLSVVGVALSPEYVYAIGPGEVVPDSRRFGVIWLSRRALEAAYDLKGAFNDVSLRINRRVDPIPIIKRIDQLLDPYGGTGAIGRDDQISNAFLDSEMQQLKNLTRIMPPIFLAVAAFLLNIVIGRLVQTEREQIGLLKAFGYSNGQLGWHYFKFVFAVAALGVLIGSGVGAWMGHGVTLLYTELFRFPFLYFRLDPGVFGLGALISVAAAGAGALASVRRVVRIMPAVAMAPPPPTSYRRGWFEKSGLSGALTQTARMILRHVLRWPLRAALTVTGIASAVAILVSSLFLIDSVEEMMEIYFFGTARQDASIEFVEPQTAASRYLVNDLPAVLSVESYRIVPVRLQFEHRQERVALQGFAPNTRLSRLVDLHRNTVELPREGLVLSRKLAELLGAEAGDRIQVTALEGHRPVKHLMVTRVVRQYIGLMAYMDRRALNRFMGEGNLISGANLLTDSAAEADLFHTLKKTPSLLGLNVRQSSYQAFRDLIRENLFTMVFFYVLFAALIAVGVVYNSARISLSERARELASLRVLGFTQREVSLILLGELAVLTFVALPIGCASGYALAALMVDLFDTELYRIPLVVLPSTYGFAACVILVAAAASAAIVLRRIASLDLVAVLKTRE
jgi:putative ABC transport system permease protein